MSTDATSPDAAEARRTMRAVGFTRSLPVEDPQALVDLEVPRPVPGPRDLLVEVRAVSVNPVDTKVRLGGDQDEPRVLGYDAAGVVVEVGAEVTLFSPGDEVWYAGHLERPGTDAELHAVDERLVARKPTSLDFAQAAALPLTAITAWECLFDKLGLTPDDEGTLLVVGASGGVGSVLVQLAAVLLPRVRVVATSSRPETDTWVREMGADVLVDHRADDYREQVRAAAPDGVDWIFSPRTADEGELEMYVDVLAPFGEVVAIDDPETLDVAFLKPKSLSLHWELMFTRALAGGDGQLRQHRLLTEVADLVDAGRVRTTVTTVLRPLDAATLREAHRMVETGRTIGKVVVARD